MSRVEGSGLSSGGSAQQSVTPAVNLRLSGPQVLHLYCDTCSVPICRECTVGRHGGHSFVYLQEALQDSRALTIQLLADAQQGRQAIQVSPSPPFTRLPGSCGHRKPFPPPCRLCADVRAMGQWPRCAHVAGSSSHMRAEGQGMETAQSREDDSDVT